MASLGQKKKQNSAKRSWRNLTNIVKSKFRDMEIGSSVRESTARVIRFISRRLIVPFRTRFLQNNSYTDKYYFSRNQTSSRTFFNFFSRSHTKPKRRSYEYDDDYYSQIYQYQSQSRGEGTSKSKEKILGRKEEKEEEEEEEEEGMPEIADSMEDAWRRVVAASPHLQVNERADEFIYKFKESMKMEKERSFLEFQERLKRSA